MRTPLILATTVLLGAPAFDAYALSCFPCSEVQAPASFTALPANFELRVRDVDTARPTLEGPGDPELACERIDDLANLLSCRATTALTPGATYTLRDPGGIVAAQDFTVTADEDNVAPPAPTIVSITRRDRDDQPEIAAGAQQGIDIALTASEPTDSMSIEVQLAPNAGLQVQRVAATGGTDPNGVLRAFVGTTFCQCAGQLGAEVFAYDLQVRVRLVDAAGNRGPWSDTIVPEPDPEASGCTCATLPTQVPWAAFAGLLLAAYAVARRR